MYKIQHGELHIYQCAKLFVWAWNVWRITMDVCHIVLIARNRTFLASYSAISLIKQRVS